MPRLRRKTPCRECPFRRDSAPGWLGDEKDPANFIRNAESDVGNDKALPCHLRIDYTDPDWLTRQYPRADLCAGALIYARNTCKMPRDPERAEAVRSVEPSEAVFQYPYEFIEHHRGELDPIQQSIKERVEGIKRS